MSASDILDTCRGKLSGCELTAFGDLKSELILCVSASRSRPREQLDDLCRTAVGYFDACQNAAKSAQYIDDDAAGVVVGFSARHSILCMRTDADCDEFVLAVLNAAECSDEAIATLGTSARALAGDV